MDASGPEGRIHDFGPQSVIAIMSETELTFSILGGVPLLGMPPSQMKYARKHFQRREGVHRLKALNTLPANHYEPDIESIARMLLDLQSSSPVFIQNASLQAALSVLRARIDHSLLPLKHSNGISLKHRKFLWQGPCICAGRDPFIIVAS